MRQSFTKLCAIAIAAAAAYVTTTPAAERWNPKLAAEYLDARQEMWFAWPQAQSANGPCVSCHTGMPYLLARPALRSMLKEAAPTKYELGLRQRLAAHAGEKPNGALQSVETIFAANFLEGEAQRRTFDQLWTLQKSDGPLKGGWQWYSANLDPWETPAQFRYGAALAALAIGSAPSELRSTSDARARLGALVDFLNVELPSRPLHVRLAILWASTKLPSLLTRSSRDAVLDDVLRKQQRDGGWTLAALGPWADHPAAPTSLGEGSNSYATAFTTYVLEQTASRSARSAVTRARAWLEAHQDRQTGAWPAVSMNKRYPAGSMEEKFLQDAATSFAAAALAGR